MSIPVPTVGRPVIVAQHVAKRYRRLASGTAGSLRNLGELRGRTEHWALRDISLTVHEGESLGIIGSNGAGKSTLLRLLSGVSAPSRGTIELHSRISGLLTLGESLHPLLSGEENAVTAAVLSGLTRREARRRLTDIAEFAELESVMDQPLRTYSDGMKLRLAFAVSITINPQVLLIDEVLAVGDLRFRQKCLDRLAYLHEHGKVTVVLTSHELEQVESLCTRAIWLADGRVAAEGPPDEVTEHYKQSLKAATGDVTVSETGATRFGDGRVRILDVRMSSARDGISTIEQGEPLVVEVDVHAEDRVEEVVFGVSGYDDDQGALCFDFATTYDGVFVGPVHGTQTMRLVLSRVDLAPGPYVIDVGVYSADFAVAHDFRGGSYRFVVQGRPGRGVLDPPREWRLS